MIRSGQRGGHPLSDLEGKLPVARESSDRDGWLGGETPPPIPFGAALAQAGPTIDPFAEPRVKAIIDEARQAAEREGLEAGRESAAATAKELGELLSGLCDATQKALRRDAEAIADLALALAEGLIGREIAGDAERLRDGVLETLRLLEGEQGLVLRIGPEDRELLASSLSQPEPVDLGDVVIKTADGFARGEFEVESPTSLADARTARRLEALRPQLIALIEDDQ